MKMIIAVMSFLVSAQAFAGQACTANYASGIGHVLKGEARLLGSKEKIKAGETSADKLYSVSVSSVGEPSLTEVKSGKAVALASQDLAPELKLYTTPSLQLYPSGIPGTDADHRFIIILCSDENNF